MLYSSELEEGIRKWCIVGEERWRTFGANIWYIVGEDYWYMVGANAWYIIAEDYWYIVARGVTCDPFARNRYLPEDERQGKP